MKHVVSLLIFVLCASALQALTVNFNFDSSTAVTYEDGQVAVNGEKLGVVFVTGTISDLTQAPFTVDAAGQLVKTVSNVSVTWGTMTVNGSSVTTVPIQDDGKVGSVVQAQTSNTSLTSSYCYLVLFDSRSYAMVDDVITTSASGSPVSGVAIAPVGNVSSRGKAILVSNMMPILPVEVYVKAEDVATTMTDSIVNFPGQALCSQAPTSSWQSAAEITSLEVTQEDGSTSTLTGDDLTAYLTPTVSGLAVDSTTGTVTLTGASTDAMFYTIETTNSLSGTWEPLTEFLTSSGKTLDTATQMFYSRIRLDKEGTAIEIPTMEGETARFYRFGSGSSSSSEE